MADHGSALAEVRAAAQLAFEQGAPWLAVLSAVSAARSAMRTQARTSVARVRKGCPSEAAYRRHLAAGEGCAECRGYMRRVEAERRARHPEWWVRGAGRPVPSQLAEASDG